MGLAFGALLDIATASSRVAVSVTVNVFPSAIVNTEPEAGGVIVTLLIFVAIISDAI
jgi:hypothetical protein